ncbi:YecA family protein [Endozoicomonas sp. ONNA2]|uniref:YecA family protein n=1 Tax=Endozoicomonas sp. ONNA2 TaxID=2828741 RepID=UPI00214784E8
MTIQSSQSDDALAPISFDELTSHLAGLSHPSEIHGYLCGLFSAGVQPGVEQWLAQLAEQLGDKSIDEPAKQLLSRLFVQTQNALDSGSLSAALLLPDDEEALWGSGQNHLEYGASHLFLALVKGWKVSRSARWWKKCSGTLPKSA